jgi:hypothetical protein
MWLKSFARFSPHPLVFGIASALVTAKRRACKHRSNGQTPTGWNFQAGTRENFFCGEDTVVFGRFGPLESVTRTRRMARQGKPRTKSFSSRKESRQSQARKILLQSAP